jgi:cyclohexanecarboxylate-CoA ligase
VTDGSIVSWQLPTTLEALVVMSALARLGAVQNPLIPSLREAEIDLIVAQLGTTLLITPSRWRGFDHAAMAAQVADRRGCRTLVCDAATQPGEVGLPTADPIDLAACRAPRADERRWVFFTSGTTGSPKGVCHSDATMIAASNGPTSNLRLAADDVFPLVFPVAHIGGPAMFATAMRTDVQLPLIADFSASDSPAALAAFQPTALGSATPFFMAYLAAARAHGSAPLFPELRLCLAGGAAVPAGLSEQVRAELGGAGIYDGWGLTEFPMATFPDRNDDADRIVGTVGRAAPGVDVQISDSGEILVRGPQRFLGYHDAAADAGAIDDHGYVHTGDIGQLDDDGLLRITGRLKEIVIRNAENISTREIEDVLVQDPRITEVCVIGLPDPRTGERCCACVVSADDLRLADLAEICRAAGLATYKVPEQIERFASLPRNAMGKVLKDQLRLALTEPEPAR